MRKGHSFGLCHCGIVHRPSGRRHAGNCLYCAKPFSIYRDPSSPPPKFCNRICYQAHLTTFGPSEESRAKCRESILGFIQRNKRWWTAYTSTNGKRLQASGLAYRHKKGWKPPLNFAQRVREGVLRTYRDKPEILDKIREARAKQKFPFIDSSIERLLKARLDLEGIKYVPQYRVKGASTIDIALPDQRVAIYCDGNYWHSLPHVINRDRVSNVDLWLQAWQVLRFKETQLRTDLDACVLKIKEVIA